MVVCLVCTQERDESEFYAGSKVRCKECRRAAQREYRSANLEAVRSQDRKRRNSARPFSMTREERFWSYVTKGPDCWLWNGSITRGGYPSFWTGTYHVRGNRYVWKLNYGAIPSGFHVCHKCDTPLCVRLDHLWLGTKRENAEDMVAKARNARGGDHVAASLSNEQATEIRARLAGGAIGRRLAFEYGVHPMIISRIKNNRTYVVERPPMKPYPDRWIAP